LGNFHHINGTEKFYEINETSEEIAALLPESVFSEIYEEVEQQINGKPLDYHSKIAQQKESLNLFFTIIIIFIIYFYLNRFMKSLF
jgi:hypothetical protein